MMRGGLPGGREHRVRLRAALVRRAERLVGSYDGPEARGAQREERGSDERPVGGATERAARVAFQLGGTDIGGGPDQRSSTAANAMCSLRSKRYPSTGAPANMGWRSVARYWG